MFLPTQPLSKVQWRRKTSTHVSIYKKGAHCWPRIRYADCSVRPHCPDCEPPPGCTTTLEPLNPAQATSCQARWAPRMATSGIGIPIGSPDWDVSNARGGRSSATRQGPRVSTASAETSAAPIHHHQWLPTMYPLKHACASAPAAVQEPTTLCEAVSHRLLVTPPCQTRHRRARARPAKPTTMNTYPPGCQES